MKHHLLDGHDKIAWDIDETLYDGGYSAFFCDYIKAHPEKEHHVITFRSQSWAERIYDDLEPHAMLPEHFRSVHACPRSLWSAYAHGDPDNPDHARIQKFLEWKGMKAKELGCTVLVDDMRDLVIQGCDLHGIVFVDACSDEFDVIIDPQEGAVDATC